MDGRKVLAIVGGLSAVLVGIGILGLLNLAVGYTVSNIAVWIMGIIH